MANYHVPNLRMANGVEIPQVGFGVFQINNPKQAVQSVSDALEIGYRHIDTASFYNNEKEVGQAIQASDLDRSDIFVTSKLWNNVRGYDNVKRQFETTLNNLGFDYLDLYLIHWPAAGYIEAWKALEDLYEQKLIRAIGVSNFTIDQLKDLANNANILPMVDQVETHPYFQQDQLHDFLEDHNIIHESWSPLGGGKNNVLKDPVIAKIAQNHQKSPAQIVLRWHTQRGEVVIPKSVHPDRMKQNIDLFDFTLSDAEMKQIAALDRNQRVGADPTDQVFLEQSTKYGTQVQRIKLEQEGKL